MTKKKKIITGVSIAITAIALALILPSIIYIKKAEHLDVNRHNISDIYDQVYQRDHTWSETIPVGDFVRVVFEYKINSTRRIDLVARPAEDCSGQIEIYQKGKTELIEVIDHITSERWYKAYLKNMDPKVEEDTFDLRVSGCPLQFDYIEDAEGDSTGHWDTSGGSIDPKGLFVSGTNLYILQPWNNTCHIYTTAGVYGGECSYQSDNGKDDMDSDGTNVYITDYGDDKVYQELLNGTNVTSWLITDQNALNDDPGGIATDGTFLYIGDRTDSEVYIYNMDGTYAGTSFDTAANGPTSPTMMTTNGIFIYMVDWSQYIYKYEIDGTFVSKIDVSASGAANMTGIDLNDDGTLLYTVDYVDDEVYIFEAESTGGGIKVYLIQ